MITTLSYTKLGWADFKTKVGSCGSDAPKVEYSKLFYLTPIVACLHCSEKHYFIDIAKTNFHTKLNLEIYDLFYSFYNICFMKSIFSF